MLVFHVFMMHSLLLNNSRKIIQPFLAHDALSMSTFEDCDPFPKLFHQPMPLHLLYHIHPQTLNGSIRTFSN